MQKQAPSLARILIAVGFALSCFGLLLFLWATFGGPIPLKPTSYQFTADFPEATQLAQETDVRISGVSVGKVKKLDVPKNENTTRATIELDSEFAPLAQDARAILRQKTLLGETYVELTRGTGENTGQTKPQFLVPTAKDGEPAIPENGHLARSQVQEQTQIDEIFNALDPVTRQNFRLWQQNASIAGEGRALDLNDALGNLGPFAADAAEVLKVIRRQNEAFGDLINHTGGVFEALSSRGDELAGAITGSNATFGALASRDQALAETIKIFPTFNRETRLTFNRLDRFARNTRPLILDLKPVARDLTPTLRSIRRLSPFLKRLFINLGPLIDASETGLPALSSFLDELAPVLVALDPFLANLNPVVRYLANYRAVAADFISNPPAALSGSMAPYAGQPGPRHFLRQISYMSPESLSVNNTRFSTNRGHGYLQPGGAAGTAAFGGADIATLTMLGGIFPNFDCDNTNFTIVPPATPPGGPVPASAATEANAACFVSGDFPAGFQTLPPAGIAGHAPQVFADP